MEIIASTSPDWPQPKGGRPTDSPHAILILDSSFNPPTLAHLRTCVWPLESPQFDAVLLLFSIANADKGVSADVDRRCELMKLLSDHIVEDTTSWLPLLNVAVGVVNAARFVDKASLLQQYLGNGSYRLYFIVGVDTLVRFFAPKYYERTDMAAVLDSFFDDPVVGSVSRSGCEGSVDQGGLGARLLCADRMSDGGPMDIFTLVRDDPIKRRHSERILTPDGWDDRGDVLMAMSSTEARRLLDSAGGIEMAAKQRLELILPTRILEYLEKSNKVPSES
ncbi:hypothetical protein BJ742DRAFT_685092 [Cladochytrium replicatum]|nr:hypothetical protein BJ742DRAFT_685092 [Cladochytrium replicatum]